MFVLASCTLCCSVPAEMLEPGALTTVIDTLWLEHIRQGCQFFCLVRPNEGCGCDPAHPRCLIIMALAAIPVLRLTSDQWLPLNANLNIPGYDSFKVAFSSH